MSTSKTEDFIGDFPNIESASFRRKIYEACLLMSMEHYESLKNNYDQDRLPSDKYYTLTDKTSTEKEIKVRSGPPKKKRNPIKKHSTDDEDVEDVDECDEKEYTNESKDDVKEKKKNKTNPIVFNKDAKAMFDFICSRFLWEIYSIEVEDAWPDSKEDIVAFALKNAHINFPNGNITKLIITSVAIMNPSKLITKSYGIDKEIRSKFDHYIDNVSVSDMVSIYLTGFLKLLCLYFTNRFWLEKTQTVNMKIFETVLRYIEITVPVDANTASFGLIAEMNQYKELVNSQGVKKSKDDDIVSNKKDKDKPKKSTKTVEKPKDKPKKAINVSEKSNDKAKKDTKLRAPKIKPKSESDTENDDENDDEKDDINNDDSE
jgi:hypothetical protein